MVPPQAAAAVTAGRRQVDKPPCACDCCSTPWVLCKPLLTCCGGQQLAPHPEAGTARDHGPGQSASARCQYTSSTLLDTQLLFGDCSALRDTQCVSYSTRCGTRFWHLAASCLEHLGTRWKRSDCGAVTVARFPPNQRATECLAPASSLSLSLSASHPSLMLSPLFLCALAGCSLL